MRALVALDRRNGESGNVLVFDDEPGVDLIGEIAQSGSEYDPHFGREILGPGSDEKAAVFLISLTSSSNFLQKTVAESSMNEIFIGK